VNKTSQHSSSSWPLLLLFAGLFLLNACAPTMSVDPPTALKQQFAQIQQQQTQQAEQIKVLQEQIGQLLQQNTVATTPPVNGQQIEQTLAVTIPASMGQELSELADSATSYLEAFSNLAAGRNAIAEAGFSNFLAKYPDHQYSPNARYWLASAQFSQGKLVQARENLLQVSADLNDQQRAPAALAMLVKIYRQQQLPKEAENTLAQLRNRYPDSREVQQFSQTTEQ